MLICRSAQESQVMVGSGWLFWRMLAAGCPLADGSLAVEDGIGLGCVSRASRGAKDAIVPESRLAFVAQT